MVRRLSLLAGILALAAPELQAQDAEPPPPEVVVVRYFECPLAAASEAVEYMNRHWRPVAREMIEEGRFLDYGIMRHAWGDEWNVVDYFVVESAAAFHEAYEEAAERMGLLDAGNEAFRRFMELCPRHKDNMYTVVPPAAAGPGESR